MSWELISSGPRSLVFHALLLLLGSDCVSTIRVESLSQDSLVVGFFRSLILYDEIFKEFHISGFNNYIRL